MSYRGCWHIFSRCLFLRYSHVRRFSSLRKEVYDPKAFILHAALLDQGFPHCPRFPTAASRRSEARVSVPPCPVALSGRVPVIALVGRYPANKLISRIRLPERKVPKDPLLYLHDHAVTQDYPVLAAVSRGYPRLGGSSITCYSPVRRCTRSPKGAFSLDLHA